MSYPTWKLRPCPTCGAGPGQPCGKRPMGVPWGWVTVKPHAARLRAAAPEGEKEGERGSD